MCGRLTDDREVDGGVSSVGREGGGGRQRGGRVRDGGRHGGESWEGRSQRRSHGGELGYI